MSSNYNFEIIIVGGSYAGLSAALALGRAVRKVLIIDSGKPCNRQTPHSHNFLTQDGVDPAHLATIAKNEVLAYPTVTFINDHVFAVNGTNGEFFVSTDGGSVYQCSKILFASGVKDLLPEIKGIAECWGISVIHCPYCHGYEYRDQPTGILTNGEMAFEYARMIRNWTKQLTIYTNGPSTIPADLANEIEKLSITIDERKITQVVHENGYVHMLELEGGTIANLSALYHRPSFVQHCEIPSALGCEMNPAGYYVVDEFQQSTIPGVYIAGDATNPFRGVSMSVAAGTKAGAMMNLWMLKGE